MAKKSISEKRADRERQENEALRWIFNVFLLGLVAECYLFFVYRGYVNGSLNALLVWDKLLRYGAGLGLVMVIVALAVGIGKRENKKLRTPMAWVGGIGAFLAITGFIMTRIYPNGVIAMCVAVPVLTLLGLIFFLFQHECFFSTLVLTCGIFTAWVRGRSLEGSWASIVLAGCVVALVVLAAAAYLVHKVQKDEGKLKGHRVLSLECDYRVLYLMLGLCAVAVVLAIAVPSITYYLLWALGILLFVELVYYTTKLM
jgi:hypothetical protein